MKLLIWVVICTIIITATAYAGEADIVDVEIRMTGKNTFHFDVTVRHADEGWKHYADKWDVVAPGGKVLGTRTLYHPHVNEQSSLFSSTYILYHKRTACQVDFEFNAFHWPPV